ncbi:hypothetical protein PybrP1_003350 [[Pythium] brassicae (nom. inval.)]|nr:hypothetical protein PybrP1_003350 [[Pythium] brassicae (nom. inval.)]
MTIPGSGNDVFTVTSARDTAKAVGELLKNPRKWREYTYVQGEETTWLKMAEAMKDVGSLSDLKIEFESVDELKQIYERKESFMSAMVAEFKLMASDGFCTFNQSKVQRDRDEFFPSLRFQTMEDMILVALVAAATGAIALGGRTAQAQAHIRCQNTIGGPAISAYKTQA